MLLHLNHPGILRSFSVLARDTMNSEASNLHSQHAEQFHTEQIAGFGGPGFIFIVNRKPVHVSLLHLS
jgi:hypothetical protein